MVFVVLAFTCLIVFYLRQSSFSPDGVPHCPTYRVRLQAHANSLLSWLLDAHCSFDNAQRLAVEATGVRSLLTKASKSNVASISAVNREKLSKRWHPISSESQSVLQATARGEITFKEAQSALQDLTDLMVHQAEIRSLRQSKLFPLAISISIGLLVITTYVVFIYVPWVHLLTKMSLP